MKKYIIFLAFVFGLTSQSIRCDTVIRDNVIDTSLVRILANPEKYNNKRVLLYGYLKIAFEESGLYLSKEDANHLNTMQALWIGGPKENANINYPSKGFVMIVGTIRYKEGEGAGHMGGWFAEISDIEQILKR